MHVNARSPQPKSNITAQKGGEQRRSNFTPCVFQSTFNIEEPAIVLQDVVTQCAAVDRTSTKETEQAGRRAYIKFAVPCINVKTQLGTEYWKIVTTVD